MRIAITGATGQVGGQIVQRLLKTNHELVLFSRNPEASPEARAKGAIVKCGDIGDENFLKVALENVDMLYLMMPPDNGAADVMGHYRRVINAALGAIKANKIQKVVLQSSYGAQHKQGTGPIVGCYQAEQTLKAVVENLYLLRNGYFMENFKWLMEPMKGSNIIPLPVIGSSKTPFVATSDIAAVAASVLSDADWQGHHLREILGPEDLSFDEVAQIISKVSGLDIRHVEMSNDTARLALTEPKVGFSREYADLFVELHRAIDIGHLAAEFDRSEMTDTPTRFDDFARREIAPLFN